MQATPFHLKVSNTQQNHAMLDLCSDFGPSTLVTVVISVLNTTASRVSVLRSGLCTWDYTFQHVPDKSEVVWSLQKIDSSSLEITCEGDHVTRSQFDNEECGSWEEEYNSLSFKATDTASLAYCATSGT